MAIKIKKKDPNSSSDAPVEVEEGDEDRYAGNRALVADHADPFTKASYDSAAWIEDNRSMVLAALGALLIAIFGGHFGLQFLDNQQVQASSVLTPALDSYNTLLEGSPELEAINANPDIKAPEKTYKTDAERWQAVYDSAEATLAKHPQGEIASSAKLSKAAAALQLGKFDEAVTLYNNYSSEVDDDAMKVAVLQGLATAYAASEKFDDAVTALDELAGLGDEFAASARYQKARLLEQQGKVEDAKGLYHQILDEDPMHPAKADIERRLASL